MGCLDSCAGKAIGFFAGLYATLIIYGLDGLIMENVESRFLMILILIVSHIVKATLLYRIVAGIITPAEEYQYQDIPATVGAVIVSLLLELPGYFFCLFVHSYLSDPSEATPVQISNYSTIRSIPMIVIMILIILATDIVTAVVRFRSINDKVYRRRLEANTYNE